MVLAQEDLISISRAPHKVDVQVAALAEKRGPASFAQTLYQETIESIARGQKLSLQLKAAAQQVRFDQKKPDQRNRDLSRKAKRGE
jgi:ribosome-associated heat shock protein Hsp15